MNSIKDCEEILLLLAKNRIVALCASWNLFSPVYASVPRQLCPEVLRFCFFLACPSVPSSNRHTLINMTALESRGFFFHSWSQKWILFIWRSDVTVSSCLAHSWEWYCRNIWREIDYIWCGWLDFFFCHWPRSLWSHNTWFCWWLEDLFALMVILQTSVNGIKQ